MGNINWLFCMCATWWNYSQSVFLPHFIWLRLKMLLFDLFRVCWRYKWRPWTWYTGLDWWYSLVLLTLCPHNYMCFLMCGFVITLSVAGPQQDRAIKWLIQNPVDFGRCSNCQTNVQLLKLAKSNWYTVGPWRPWNFACLIIQPWPPSGEVRCAQVSDWKLNQAKLKCIQKQRNTEKNIRLQGHSINWWKIFTEFSCWCIFPVIKGVSMLETNYFIWCVYIAVTNEKMPSWTAK